MARSLTDDELADRLEAQQVDRTILNEAARRIRECELRTLLHTNSIIEAINSSSLLKGEHQAEIIEQIVMAVKPGRQSTARLSSLAARVMRDPEATPRERSLAASVLSQDEIRGQS